MSRLLNDWVQEEFAAQKLSVGVPTQFLQGALVSPGIALAVASRGHKRSTIGVHAAVPMHMAVLAEVAPQTYGHVARQLGYAQLVTCSLNAAFLHSSESAQSKVRYAVADVVLATLRRDGTVLVPAHSYEHAMLLEICRQTSCTDKLRLRLFDPSGFWAQADQVRRKDGKIVTLFEKLDVPLSALSAAQLVSLWQAQNPGGSPYTVHRWLDSFPGKTGNDLPRRLQRDQRVGNCLLKCSWSYLAHNINEENFNVARATLYEHERRGLNVSLRYRLLHACLMRKEERAWDKADKAAADELHISRQSLHQRHVGSPDHIAARSASMCLIHFVPWSLCVAVTVGLIILGTAAAVALIPITVFACGLGAGIALYAVTAVMAYSQQRQHGFALLEAQQEWKVVYASEADFHSALSGFVSARSGPSLVQT